MGQILSRTSVMALSWVAIAALLVGSSKVSYLLYHSLVELFTVLTGLMVGIVAWYTHRFARNRFLVVLGLAYPWGAIIDLLHALSYKGMNVFPQANANLPTQLWLAARLLESGALLLATRYLRYPPPDPAYLLLGFGIMAAALVIPIFAGVFPTAYIDGVGLTPFKVAAEYTIIAILIISAIRLWQDRGVLDRYLLRLLLGALALTVVGELAFTIYIEVHDLSNLIGHLCKLASYTLVFLGIVRTGLAEPFSMLTRDSTTYDAIPEQILVVDRQGKVRQMNRLLTEAIGTDAVGQDCHEIAHPPDMAREECPLCAAIIRGESVDGVELAFGERWQLISLAPIRAVENVEGVVHVARDITDLKRVEQALEKANRVLRATSAINQALQRGEDEASVIEDVCRIVMSTGGYRMAWVGFAERDEHGPCIRVAAWAGSDKDCIADNAQAAGADLCGTLLAETALLSGRVELIDSIVDNPSCRAWRDEARRCGVASLAALPLASNEKSALGVLVIYSGHTHAFSSEELSILRELAGDLAFGIDALRNRIARREADRRLEAQTAALRSSEQRLAHAQRIAQLGSWEWEVRTGLCYWSDEMFRILGLPPNPAGTSSWSEFWKCVHPEDHSILSSAIDGALGGSGALNIDHRIVLPDGVERIVHKQATVVFDEGGVPVRIAGTMQDITERCQDRAALERAQQDLEKRVEERTAELSAANAALSFTQFAMDNAGESIFWFTDDGCLIYVNDAACKILDYRRMELLQMKAPDLGASDAWEEAWARLHRHGRTEFEAQLLGREGKVIPVEIVASYLEYGDRDYVCAFVRDITSRREMEGLLLRQHEAEKIVSRITSRFVDNDTPTALRHALSDLGDLMAADSVWLLQSAGDDDAFVPLETWVAKNGAQSDGRSPGQTDCISLEYWIESLKAGSVVTVTETRGAGASAQGGNTVELFVPVFSSGRFRAVIAFYGVRHGERADESERTLVQIAVKSIGNALARHEAEVRRAVLLEENRRLVQESITAQEKERAYLARELHDELGQSLTAIRADAGLIERRSRGGDMRIHESARAIIDVSARVYHVVRKLMRRMRPEVLDSLGLVEAVTELIEDWRARRSELSWSFHSEGALDVFPDGVAIGIYRIVQECITNVVKHADASLVEIELKEVILHGTPYVTVSVADDGRGIDHARRSSGTGLLGMRERVLCLNGEFEVRSRRSGGTEVWAAFPLVPNMTSKRQHQPRSWTHRNRQSDSSW